MTDAFERFITQSRAEGSAYGDGYDSSHFDGMSEAEEAEAAAILERRARGGDNIAISGLAVLGTPRAISTLRELASAVRPPSQFHIDVCDALWRATGDRAWQYELERDLATDDEKVFERALVTLVRMVDAESGPRLRDSFVRVLMVSDNGILRSQAAEAILRSYGLPARGLDPRPERLEMNRRLYRATPETIDDVLSEAAALAAGPSS